MCQFHPIHIFIHCCHRLIVLNVDVVHSCWSLHLGSRFLQIRGLWNGHGSLDFCALDCGLVIVLSCLCFLDAIIELSAMDDKKCSMTFLLSFVCNKLLFNSTIIFFICSGGISYIILKDQYKYISPYSSRPLVCMHLVFYVNFLYIGGLNSQRPTHVIQVSNEESTPPSYYEVVRISILVS